MDWKECIKKRIAKDVKKDINMIGSAREIADVKIKSADALPNSLYYGKITLLYDALREYLECIALENGYKIYNHECYTAFLREIMHLLREADIFDKLRKIMNGINYYGKKISENEAAEIVNDLRVLIQRFKN